ncbi:MAG: hypothetical protein UZ18_ATM001001506 [Armatimonadetes bacterium OLB18]|nr:MAG: hypothetical protein UZ18_ATM001001506 [Armatimonadetes bacterium OLB18]
MPVPSVKSTRPFAAFLPVPYRYSPKAARFASLPITTSAPSRAATSSPNGTSIQFWKTPSTRTPKFGAQRTVPVSPSMWPGAAIPIRSGAASRFEAQALTTEEIASATASRPSVARDEVEARSLRGAPSRENARARTLVPPKSTPTIERSATATIVAWESEGRRVGKGA